MKKFLTVIVLLVLVYVIGGMFMSSKFDVTRSTLVDAPQADVHKAVANLRKWDNWSIWNSRADATLKNTYEGAEMGVGAKWKWQGDSFGNGMMEITNATDSAMDFALSGDFEMKGRIELEAISPTQTKVTWNANGDVGNSMAMMARWMNGLGLADGMMNQMYDQSLAGLKEYVEGGGVKAVNAHMTKTDK